jgi:DNA-binding transcriptional MerR regulator
VTPKLFKAAEVCDMAQLQSYVLRSWEKEFPGIGVQKSPDSPRLYRQSDVEQVLRIKQLVFGEGLTLSGARRRLEVQPPAAQTVSDEEVEEVLDALASDARTRIAYVRDGLRSILNLLSTTPGTVVVVNDDYQLSPPAFAKGNGGAGAAKKTAAKKVAASSARSAATRSKPRIAAKPARNSKPLRKARRASA